MDQVKISAFAKTVKRPQVSQVSGNVANSVTTRKPEDGSYELKDAMFAVVSMENPHSNILDKKGQPDANRAEIMELMEDHNHPRLQYDPGHHDAPTQGHVAYPNVNVIKEMADIITVTKAYEGNVPAPADQPARTYTSLN